MLVGFKLENILKCDEAQFCSVPRRINIPAMLIHVLADDEAWVHKTDLWSICKTTDVRILLQHVLFLSLLLLEFLGAQIHELHLLTL